MSGGALDAATAAYQNDPGYLSHRLMLDVGEQVVKQVDLDNLPSDLSRNRNVRRLLEGDERMSIRSLVTACQTLGLTVKITVERRESDGD